MSLTELAAEVSLLTAEELETLRKKVEAALAKKKRNRPVNMTEYVTPLRGTIIFKPGWDAPEPIEDWNALRDNTPL